MYKKTAGLLAAGILSITPLVAAPAAGAADDFPPPGCLATLYSVFLGQGVQLTCYSLPGLSRTYQVVAHCQSGSSYWYTAGQSSAAGIRSVDCGMHRRAPLVGSCRRISCSRLLISYF